MGASSEVRATARALLAALGRGVLDAVLPPRCPACGDGVDRQGGLCPACWVRLTFLGPPWCSVCGLPFEVAGPLPGEALWCGRCLARPPLFTRARAALSYDQASRPLVLALKHGDRTFLAEILGGWLVRAGRELLAESDLLIPVPLHRWRLFHRRYNQSALLAAVLGRQCGLPLATGLLHRSRATPSQGGLDPAARRRNIDGAFVVPGSARARVAGARLLLVDDVLTTGATVGECARVLRQAGAARVDVLTLTRVLPEERPPQGRSTPSENVSGNSGRSLKIHGS